MSYTPPLIERFGVRRPSAALVMLFGLSVASLAWVPANPWCVYAIFAVIGLSGSAATAMPYAVDPGASYRALASYTPALLCFAVLLGLCTIIVCRLGPYEYPPSGKAQPRFSPARARG